MAFITKAEKFYKTLGRCSISSYHSSPSVSCAAQVQKQPDPHINSKVGGLSWKIYDVAGPIMIGQRDFAGDDDEKCISWRKNDEGMVRFMNSGWLWLI